MLSFYRTFELGTEVISSAGKLFHY